jgi:hypothetical protein
MARNGWAVVKTNEGRWQHQCPNCAGATVASRQADLVVGRPRDKPWWRQPQISRSLPRALLVGGKQPGTPIQAFLKSCSAVRMEIHLVEGST